jgi:hypothetical protein
MSTSNHILSDMIDIIRIRIQIRLEICKQISFQYYASVSDPFSYGDSKKRESKRDRFHTQEPGGPTGGLPPRTGWAMGLQSRAAPLAVLYPGVASCSWWWCGVYPQPQPTWPSHVLRSSSSLLPDCLLCCAMQLCVHHAHTAHWCQGNGPAGSLATTSFTRGQWVRPDAFRCHACFDAVGNFRERSGVGGRCLASVPAAAGLRSEKERETNQKRGGAGCFDNRQQVKPSYSRQKAASIQVFHGVACNKSC